MNHTEEDSEVSTRDSVKRKCMHISSVSEMADVPTQSKKDSEKSITDEREVEIKLEIGEPVANKTERQTDSPASPSMRYRDPDWEEELRHYHKIAATFRRYKKFSYDKVDKTINFIRSMPRRHQSLLQDYRKHIEEIKKCIDINHNLFQLMILDAASMFENHDEVYPEVLKTSPPEPTAFDYDKVQAVLKHIMRDWTSEGQKERDTCYKPLIDEVEHLYGATRPDTFDQHLFLEPSVANRGN